MAVVHALVSSMIVLCACSSGDATESAIGETGHEDSAPSVDTSGRDIDIDGDGHDDEAEGGDDCDDTNDGIHPGAADPCGGVDWDCDGDEPGCAPGVVSLAEAHGTLAPESASATGLSAALADVDGDGHADLIAAFDEIEDDVYDSKVAVVLMPVYGDIPEASVSARLGGEGGRDYSSVSASGADVTGDGVVDLVMGASVANVVDVYSGDTLAAGTASSPDATVYGSDDQLSGLGLDLALGDANGDGEMSLYVSALGLAAIVAGPIADGTTVHSASLVEFTVDGDDPPLGRAVTAADVDGDGRDELIVCAQYDPTSSRSDIYVIDGSRRGALALGDEDVRLSAEVDARELGGAGYDLAAGDTDGDGYADLVVGAPFGGAEGHGVVMLLAGPFDAEMSLAASTATLSAPSSGVLFGIALAMADTDGDDLVDVLVGAYGSDEGAGAAALFHGPFAGAVELASDPAGRWFAGAAEGDRAGTSVALGDADGDGMADVAVTAPFRDATGTDSGLVALFYSTIGY